MLNNDKRWYLRKDKKVHEVVYGKAQSLLEKDTRRYRYRELRRVYAPPLYGDESLATSEDEYEIEYGSRHPIVANAIDTVHSKIAKNRPGPKVLTSDGSWKLQRKAKLLQQYLEGEIKRLKVYTELAPAVLWEALVTGTGALHCFEQNGRPMLELRYCDELFVDRQEEFHRSVRSLYSVRPVDRQVLMEMFPEHKAKIQECEETYEDDMNIEGYAVDDADMLLVVEAWRRGTKGRHVVCIGNTTLVNEDYTDEDFPFIFLRWLERPRSFWGIGMVERMALQQTEVDDVSDAISDNVARCQPKLLVPREGNIEEDSITDEGWQCLKYSGAPPSWVAPEPNAMGTVAYRDQTIAGIYEQNGISQLSAQSQKPEGLDSGAAIRTYQDVESERFYLSGLAYETFHMGICEKVVGLAESIYERSGGKDLVVFAGQKKLRRLAFGQVRMGNEPYEIRVYPVSKLANTVSGKIAQISELQQLGVLTDPQAAAKLLDLPDLEAYQGLESAARDFAEDIVGRALDGEPVGELVSPYIDLDYAHKIGMQSFNKALYDGADLDDLASLHTLLGVLEAQIAEREAALAPPPPLEGPGLDATAGIGMGQPGAGGPGMGPIPGAPGESIPGGAPPVGPIGVV